MKNIIYQSVLGILNREISPEEYHMNGLKESIEGRLSQEQEKFSILEEEGEDTATDYKYALKKARNECDLWTIIYAFFSENPDLEEHFYKGEEFESFGREEFEDFIQK